LTLDGNIRNHLLAMFYAYMGYPACLWFLALIKRDPVTKENIRPYVSLVASVYTEERILA